MWVLGNLGMVRMFAQFGFATKVGEREMLNYALPGNTIVSLVSAGQIAYMELECMSSRDDLEQNKQKILAVAKQLELKLLTSKEEFYLLCDRLSEQVDWIFHADDKDYARLAELLKNYAHG